MRPSASIREANRRPRGSPIRAATASSLCNGRPVIGTASPRPTGRTECGAAWMRSPPLRCRALLGRRVDLALEVVRIALDLLRDQLVRARGGLLEHLLEVRLADHDH